MRGPGSWWRVDGWFRPVRADGSTYSRGPRREVEAKDRKWMWATLLTCVAAIACIITAAPTYLIGASGAFLPLATLQAVNLYRTRHLR